VSDKTLVNIAKALNMKAYELLIPLDTGKAGMDKGDTRALQQTAELIKAKKGLLRKMIGDGMDDLILEILKMYGE
jgi:ABC-type branched-subunit amino acid transport system ATPase component